MSEVKDMVNVIIDGKNLQVHKASTVLLAARKAGIKVPSLCYHPELRPEGACRICVVEVEGVRTLVASCVYPVSEGMVVHTNTPRVRRARQAIVELMLANHPPDCLFCVRNQNCELQNISADLGMKRSRFEGERKIHPLDDNNPSLVRDQSKCILCGRCIRVCAERQGTSVYSFINRGFHTTVSPAFGNGLDKSTCTFCGQCSSICPTGAIVEKDETESVWDILSDKTKHVIVQTAPSVRVGLGEMLGLEPGSIVTGKMVAALRHMGFAKVFDTDFAADLTIMEEASELVHRIQNGGTLPMTTSCSPGWVNFVEMNFPDLLEHVSTAKSPMSMFGAVAKSYYAEKMGIDPKDIVSVAIMPCTAKKYEAKRPEMENDGTRNIDYVLTTREFGRMIKEIGIDFNKIKEEEFDSLIGYGSGAGHIFGITGGVMEAALRTAYETITGKTLETIEFKEVRGLTTFREATIKIGNLDLKVAVIHTLEEARKVMERVSEGKAEYHFVEIMACPGGCLSGGGQPIPINSEIRAKRRAALYSCDEMAAIRKSHENPEIIEIYKEWLGAPLGEKSHKYLHTHYHKQLRDI